MSPDGDDCELVISASGPQPWPRCGGRAQNSCARDGADRGPGAYDVRYCLAFGVGRGPEAPLQAPAIAYFTTLGA